MAVGEWGAPGWRGAAGWQRLWGNKGAWLTLLFKAMLLEHPALYLAAPG